MKTILLYRRQCEYQQRASHNTQRTLCGVWYSTSDTTAIDAQQTNDNDWNFQSQYIRLALVPATGKCCRFAAVNRMGSAHQHPSPASKSATRFKCLLFKYDAFLTFLNSAKTSFVSGKPSTTKLSMKVPAPRSTYRKCYPAAQGTQLTTGRLQHQRTGEAPSSPQPHIL